MSSIHMILNKFSVHVPSIARARLMPTVFLRRPLIYIQGHNGWDLDVKYPLGGWEEAKKDFDKLQSEMVRVQRVLSKNSSTEDSDE